MQDDQSLCAAVMTYITQVNIQTDTQTHKQAARSAYVNSTAS